MRLTHGYLLNNVAYNNYAEYHASQNTSGVYTAYIATGLGNGDNSSHNLEVDYLGSGDWESYIDGSMQETHYGGFGYGGCIGSTGLEVATGGKALSTFKVNTYNATSMQWEDSTGHTHAQWNSGQFWIDDPCGSSPAGSCFNGVFYSQSSFSANKP